MGDTGSTLLDFGAHPGSPEASVVITGQTSIAADSLAEAWLIPEDTADHSADEHLVEDLELIVTDVVAGTGFTIRGQRANAIEQPRQKSIQGVACATARKLGQSPDGDNAWNMNADPTIAALAVKTPNDGQQIDATIPSGSLGDTNGAIFYDFGLDAQVPPSAILTGYRVEMRRSEDAAAAEARGDNLYLGLGTPPSSFTSYGKQRIWDEKWDPVPAPLNRIFSYGGNGDMWRDNSTNAPVPFTVADLPNILVGCSAHDLVGTLTTIFYIDWLCLYVYWMIPPRVPMPYGKFNVGWVWN